VSVRVSMQGMFTVACALLAFAATAQRAQAAPKPVAPPHAHHQALKPVPWPGASSTNSSSSTGFLSTSIPAVRRVARSAVIARAIYRPDASASATPQRPAPRSKAPPPAQDRGRPVGFQDAAGLSELRSAASSSSSTLPLAAGIALLLLVIGETTFLGLASSRLGVSGPRGPVTRRPPEEPLPIRRVQLRR